MNIATTVLSAALLALMVGGSLILWHGHRQARAITRALGPEIAGLRIQAAVLALEIARHHAAGAPFDAGFFASRRLSKPQLFLTVGWRIALLGREATDRVGYFHAQLAEARLRRSEAIAAGGLTGSPYRLLSNLMRACNHVEPWLRNSGCYDELTDTIPVDLAPADRLLSRLEDEANEPVVLAYCWADVGLKIGETGEDTAPLRRVAQQP